MVSPSGFGPGSLCSTHKGAAKILIDTSENFWYNSYIEMKGINYMSQTLLEAFEKAGYKPPKARKAHKDKPVKCRKCGSIMQKVEQTNLLLCPGEIEVKDSVTIPCDNRIILNLDKKKKLDTFKKF